MFLHGALHVALGGAFCHVLALVVELFALAETDLHLDAAVLEIQADGDQRIAGLLDDAVETSDLLFVHEQLAHAHRVAVEDVALLIGRDVHAVDKDFALVDRAPAVLEVDPALTDGFDLGAEQLDACLVALFDKIVVPRLFVLRDRFQ